MLSLDDGATYMCQFGCPIKVTKLHSLYSHWYNNHSFDELKLWGINRDLLANVDSTGSIGTCSVTKTDHDKANHNYGITPPPITRYMVLGHVIKKDHGYHSFTDTKFCSDLAQVRPNMKRKI